ncbi:alpha/beta hydrolase family protein [Pendulispora albinea]|uniref:Alpha/beta hydrolase family protein n=1 Tax=Pendulispora albinea TaxID=2741071 RepID=A0ABZ2LYH2_9BACT
MSFGDTSNLPDISVDDNVISLFGPWHPLDRLIGYLNGRSRLFVNGWGDERVLASVLDTEPFQSSPAAVAIAWDRPHVARGVERTAGRFVSPNTALPEPVRAGHVQRLRSARPRGGPRTACVVLAGSREEGFALRQGIFGPLAREGIDLYLLENPYYGLRRPPGQRGASLGTVAEHVLMNLAIVDEARSLLATLREGGYEQIGVTGYSMGGFMAGLAASLTREPLAVAALAAGASPAPVFTRGLLAHSIDFTDLGGSAAGAEAARRRLASLFDRARLTHFPAPLHARSAILLACRRDGYVPRTETLALHAHWASSELRWVNAGHISALFTERHALRAAVRDAFARLRGQEPRHRIRPRAMSYFVPRPSPRR